MGKAKIVIDYDKCGDPRECRICVGVCPPGVLNLIFTDTKNYHDPQDWIIKDAFPHLCTGDECNLCIEKCPNNAITIK